MANKIKTSLLVKGKRRCEMRDEMYEKSKDIAKKNGWRLATEKQIELHYKLQNEVKPIVKPIEKIEVKAKEKKEKEPVKIENPIPTDNKEILDPAI